MAHVSLHHVIIAEAGMNWKNKELQQLYDDCYKEVQKADKNKDPQTFEHRAVWKMLQRMKEGDFTFRFKSFFEEMPDEMLKWLPLVMGASNDTDQRYLSVLNLEAARRVHEQAQRNNRVITSLSKAMLAVAIVSGVLVAVQVVLLLLQ